MERIIFQLIAAVVGTVGFSLIFNVGKKFLAAAAAGGFITWGSFLVCQEIFVLDVLLCAVLAAAIGQIYAEFMARIFKSPTTVFFIPAAVPLIPGGSLYNTMSAAVNRDWGLLRYRSMQTLMGTLGIAIGLSLVSAVLYVVNNYKKHK